MAIDRQLVTVAAFRDLIAAGGYDEPSYWSPEGWRWRTANAITHPRFWDDPEWRAYLAPDLPVVGVSAYEAEAYASFRGQRLPSVGEWDRACRGEADRKYPWGDDWREGCCGHRDDGTRGTRPVGSFPSGATPGGHLDLCGSVWQWTRDAQGDQRIACGGAWNNLPWSIGCGSRNAFPPDARFSHLGFRCAK